LAIKCTGTTTSGRFKKEQWDGNIRKRGVKREQTLQSWVLAPKKPSKTHNKKNSLSGVTPETKKHKPTRRLNHDEEAI